MLKSTGSLNSYPSLIFFPVSEFSPAWVICRTVNLSKSSSVIEPINCSRRLCLLEISVIYHILQHSFILGISVRDFLASEDIKWRFVLHTSRIYCFRWSSIFANGNCSQVDFSVIFPIWFLGCVMFTKHLAVHVWLGFVRPYKNVTLVFTWSLCIRSFPAYNFYS